LGRELIDGEIKHILNDIFEEDIQYFQYLDIWICL
jgi:hypothetical protein